MIIGKLQSLLTSSTGSDLYFLQHQDSKRQRNTVQVYASNTHRTITFYAYLLFVFLLYETHLLIYVINHSKCYRDCHTQIYNKIYLWLLAIFSYLFVRYKTIGHRTLNEKFA